MYVCFIQRTEDYEKQNPMKQVPSLIIDGVTLTQSVSAGASCLKSLSAVYCT